MKQDEVDGQRRTVMLTALDAKMLRAVSERMGVTMADAAKRLFRATLVREYRRCVAEMQRELGGES